MSSLKDKLYNYEQDPPEKAWDKIAAALDESHLDDKFPSQLYNTEAVPPANAWNKIADALQQEEAPAARMPQRRSVSFFRYAAAAVLIGLVAFGVVKWMNNGSNKAGEGTVIIDTVRRPQPGQSQENGIANNTEKTTEPAEENTNDEASTASIKASSVKRARNNYQAGDNSYPAEPIYAYNENTPNIADRYIMYMTPDGGIVRMAKKWGNLVCCVSGQEQDEDCKDQLKKWQEKLACSPVATSNFMDIFSLVSTLNDTEL